jgi:hypothetical protein
MVDSNGSAARTSMNNTTETQQQWVVNGDGRHDGDSAALGGMDGATETRKQWMD